MGERNVIFIHLHCCGYISDSMKNKSLIKKVSNSWTALAFVFPSRSCITHWSPRKRRAQRTRHFQGNKNCFISEQQYAARIPKLFNCFIFQPQIWLRFLHETTLESLFFNPKTLFTPDIYYFLPVAPTREEWARTCEEKSHSGHSFQFKFYWDANSDLTEHLFTQTWQPRRRWLGMLERSLG